jgi:hypothetical protein
MHLPAKSEWYMDCGASSHTASALGNVKNLKPSSSYNVTVGNGASLYVSHIGSQTITCPTKSLSLRDILIVPHIIKNLFPSAN